MSGISTQQDFYLATYESNPIHKHFSLPTTPEFGDKELTLTAISTCPVHVLSLDLFPTTRKHFTEYYWIIPSLNLSKSPSKYHVDLSVTDNLIGPKSFHALNSEQMNRKKACYDVEWYTDYQHEPVFSKKDDRTTPFSTARGLSAFLNP